MMEIPGYDISRPIGEGGMATAFLAVQKSLGRQVVLKVLNTAHIDSKEEVERFLNEGRIIAALNHPHIVTIYDIGIADESVFMSMEYVEGGDLKQRLQTSVFSPPQALDLVVRIASALDVAHQKGIIHRDVKPGNILFRKDGTPLLSDFGIAKQLTLDHDLTHTGIFLGSPNYMAPEQAEAGPIDGRVDIYALGVILYEMLTGAKPFKSDSIVDIIVKHRTAPIPRLPEGLEIYQPLIDLMMAKRRKDRFRDCASLIHFIHQLQARSAQDAQHAAARLDLDVTGRNLAGDKTVAAALPPPLLRRKKKANAALVGLLIAAASTFGGMTIAVNYVKREPDRLKSLPQQSPVGAEPVVAAAAVPPTLGAGAPAADEVLQALLWLGQKSLEEYRLTAPPKDNAFYYFSRLLQIDPNNVEARKGLAQVAERFAFLAERELANDNAAQAQNYIAIGLQVDPGNPALQALQGLARPNGRGVMQTLKGLFSSG